MLLEWENLSFRGRGVAQGEALTGSGVEGDAQLYYEPLTLPIPECHRA